MKILVLRGLLIVCLTLLSAAKLLSDQYINDRFQYPSGDLGSHWAVSNDTGGSTATIEAAYTLNGYRPDGKQATLNRPSTSAGTAYASIAGGEKTHTLAHALQPGSAFKVSTHVAFTNMNNGQSFQLRLREGSNKIVVLRIQGQSTSAGIVQYDTDGTNDFVNLPGGSPVLSINNWYKIEAAIEIGELGAWESSTMALSITDMSDGSVVYNESGIEVVHFQELTADANINFMSMISSGLPTYGLAKVSVTSTDGHAVPPAYVSDRITDDSGSMGAPWTVYNETGGSSAIVSSSSTHGLFRPVGNQVTFDRPTTGGGTAYATIDLGEGTDRDEWFISEDDKIRAILHFSYSSLGNTNRFSFRLRQSNDPIASISILGTGGNQGVIQYASNGYNNYQNLPGTAPTLSANTWYRLEAVISVDDLSANGDVTMDLKVLNLSSSNATLIYPVIDPENPPSPLPTPFTFTHSTAIDDQTSNISLSSGILIGTPTFSLAKVDILPILSDNPINSGGSDLRISEFSGFPDDSTSDTDAVYKALAVAQDLVAPAIIFDQGVYNLDAIPGQACIDISGFDFISVHGDNTELIGGGPDGILEFSGCLDIEVTGIRTDMDVLPYTAGQVITSDEDNCVIEVAPGHPVLTSPVVMIDTVENVGDGTYPFYKSGNNAYYNLSQKNESTPNCETVEDFPNRLQINRWESAKKSTNDSPGTLHSGNMPAANSYVVAYYYKHGSPAIQVRNARNVYMEDIEVYASAGMGFMFQNAREDGVLQIVDCHVMRRPNSTRWKSTSLDGIHFSLCRGQINLINCSVEDTGDDGINVHGFYAMVYSRIDDYTLVFRGWANGFVTTPSEEEEEEEDILIAGMNKPKISFQDGDTYEFSDADLAGIHVPSLTGVTQVGDSREFELTLDSVEYELAEVTFDQALPTWIEPGSIVANEKEAPPFYMYNCTVSRTRTQGMRIKTRNALVEDSTFNNTAGNGIRIFCTADDGGYASISTRNVTIRNCDFIDCQRAIRIGAGSTNSDFGVHKDLLIEGCTMQGSHTEQPIWMRCIDGVTIRSNTFYITGENPVNHDEGQTNATCANINLYPPNHYEFPNIYPNSSN